MKCEQIQPNLLDYSRGTLSVSEKTEIREHLKTCDDCSAVLQEEISLDTMFKSVPPAEPTADIWNIVESRISSSKPGIMDRLRIMSRMRLFKATGAIAVTAALLAVITFQFRPEQRTANNGIISNDSVAVANVSVKWTDDPTGDSSDAMAKYIEGL
jgi:anti-sigma-K factor RskA